MENSQVKACSLSPSLTARVYIHEVRFSCMSVVFFCCWCCLVVFVLVCLFWKQQLHQLGSFTDFCKAETGKSPFFLHPDYESNLQPTSQLLDKFCNTNCLFVYSMFHHKKASGTSVNVPETEDNLQSFHVSSTSRWTGRQISTSFAWSSKLLLKCLVYLYGLQRLFEGTPCKRHYSHHSLGQ